MIRIALSLACCFALAGCVTAPSSSYPLTEPTPAEAPGSPISQLLTGALTGLEQQLQETLKREMNLQYPIRLGILFYQYGSNLNPADQQQLFEQAQANFAASGLVRETIQLSNTLVGNNASIDTLRQMGARFQTDVLVIVAGNNAFKRSLEQPLSFFDSFSDRPITNRQLLWKPLL